MIAPIEPEPFNHKSLKSWLIKVIIPLGVIIAVFYSLLPYMLDTSCTNCVNWGWFK